MTQLEVEDLQTSYPMPKGPIRAVDHVSFSLQNESIGIAGESGCGKSTLGFSLLRLVPSPGMIQGGRIILDGTDLLSMPEEEHKRKIRWREISMVFQGAMNALSPVYTVEHQLAEPIIYHTNSTKKEAREKAKELLEEIGLEPSILRRYPHELSGGMKQRVVIAMALILDPKVLIADEPTTALDVIVQAQIINLLKKLKREKSLSIVLITHDLSVISEIADKVAVMYAGEIVEYGSSDAVYISPKHPYTQKLLAAIPRLRGEKRKLESIGGWPPDLMNPPQGCRFHPRCPFVMDVCKEKTPPIFHPDPGHLTTCWLYKDG